MKPLLEATNVETNFNAQEFTIDLGREQVAHFTRLLVTHQYNKPLSASVREIVSNAYDANLETKAATGVMPEVVVTIFDDRISVRDYGPGLDEESIRNLYSVIGRSTKHGNENQIGAYGIGRLAPLALNKNFFVESYFNGTKSLYCIYLNENHIPAVSLWDSEPTDERNGLNVFILVPAKELKAENNDGLNTNVLLATVYEIVDGSRYPVVVKSNIPYAYDRLVEDHHLSDHLYFTLDLDSFLVDYYLKEKISYNSSFAHSDAERTSIFFDLGGALYPLDARSTNNNFKSNRTGSSSCVVKRAEELLPLSNPRFENLTSYSFKRELMGCSIIIRLKPGDLMLNTSREEIVLSDEQKDKITAIQSRAIIAVNAELQVRADKKFKEIFTEITKDATSAQEEFSRALYLFKNFPVNPVYLGYRRESPITLSVVLSNGLTVRGVYQTHESSYSYNPFKLNRGIASITAGEGEEVSVTLESSSYSAPITDGYINTNAKNLYMLVDKEKCETSPHFRLVLSNAFKTGISKFHANVSTSTKLRFNWLMEDVQILLVQSHSGLTHRGVAKVLGEHVLDKPVLVLNYNLPSALAEKDKYFTKLKDCINYLGIYTEPEVVKAPKPTSSNPRLKAEHEKEISILLRQLNKDSANADIAYFNPLGGNAPKRVASPLECINADKDFRYTEDILTKKVIYWRADDVVRNRGFNNYVISQSMCNIMLYLPPVFYKEYDYKFRVTISDKAADRVENLKKQGHCNWVPVTEVVAKAIEKYFDLWGAQGLFLSSPVHQKILSYLVKSPLKPYLPKPTLRLHYWSDSLKSMLVKFPMYNSNNESNVRDYGVSSVLKANKTNLDEKALKVSPLYAPYKMDSLTEVVSEESLLGEVLSPYYEMLYWALYNNHNIDVIVQDIAFSLEAKGITILR